MRKNGNFNVVFFFAKKMICKPLIKFLYDYYASKVPNKKKSRKVKI